MDVDCAAGWKSQPAIHTSASSDIPDETTSDERRERAIPMGSASATARCEVREIMWRQMTTSTHASDEVVRRARRRLRACTSLDTFVASQVADV
jgi:hypothetical protein